MGRCVAPVCAGLEVDQTGCWEEHWSLNGLILGDLAKSKGSPLKLRFPMLRPVAPPKTGTGLDCGWDSPAPAPTIT